jgi:hypothetical protein
MAVLNRIGLVAVLAGGLAAAGCGNAKPTGGAEAPPAGAPAPTGAKLSGQAGQDQRGVQIELKK